MFCQYTYERTVQLVAVLAENTSFELTRPLVHPLGTLFKQGYTDMSSDAKLAIVKALSNLSQGSTQQIQAVMETNTTRAIACFLTNEDRQLVHSSLKCLMNLTEGNESQTQTVISTPGVLSSVRQIIDSRKVSFKKYVVQLIIWSALACLTPFLGLFTETSRIGCSPTFRECIKTVASSNCCTF